MNHFAGFGHELSNASPGIEPVKKLAWKIDQQRAKLIKASGENLLCPRSGIYTADGGR